MAAQQSAQSAHDLKSRQRKCLFETTVALHMNPLTTTSLLFLSSLIAFADVEFDSTKLRAEKGDIEAQIDLARMYESGEGAPKDFYGIGVPKDRSKGVGLYEEAAKNGCIEAQKTLGLNYSAGKELPKDSQKAFGWYLKAAEQGDVESQMHVGTAYVEGAGVQENWILGRQWLQKAVEQKTENVYQELAQEFLNAIPESMATWMENLRASANQGDAEAQQTLGQNYATQKNGIKPLFGGAKPQLKGMHLGNSTWALSTITV